MAITTEAIKRLRAETGCGVMEAKEVLRLTNGDWEQAKVELRKRGQKVALRKQVRVAGEGVIGSYLHANGKVAGLVALSCETDFVARNAEFKTLAHDLAMQVAAAAPKYIAPQDISPAELKLEQEAIAAELSASHKLQAVRDKIMAGKLAKFYSQICLLKQPFIKDDKLTVEEYITSQVLKLGEKIEVKKIVYLNI